ncbi:TetR/AcrR family transcriptional regulator [Mycolicibacterium lutetiense]|jgi:AcrR family transcriptional regulator
MAEQSPAGRPRDPSHDAAILDAALDLMIDRGADSASIEAIARRAGVAKLTVYRRWKNKDELLIAALERAKGTDPDLLLTESSIDAVVTSVARQLSDRRFRSLMARVIGASVDQPMFVETYRREYLQPRLTALIDIARRAIEDGRFPPDTDPETITDILSSSVGFVLLSGKDITADQIERRLRALLRQMGYRGDAP